MIFAHFSAFYGQCSVAEPGPTPSPGSIHIYLYKVLHCFKIAGIYFFLLVELLLVFKYSTMKYKIYNRKSFWTTLRSKSPAMFFRRRVNRYLLLVFCVIRRYINYHYTLKQTCVYKEEFCLDIYIST